MFLASRDVGLFFSLPGLSFPQVQTLCDTIGYFSIRAQLEGEEIVLMDTQIDEENQLIRVKFPVVQAGRYYIYVSYRGYEVAGSPFSGSIKIIIYKG